MKFSFRFLPVKDLFYSVFPTVGTYGGYLQGFAPRIFPNMWIALGAGLVLSVLLALVFYTENVKTYRRSLAEVLATGYFMNFTGRLGRLLRTKTPVNILFPDHSVRAFKPSNIYVEIGMPDNLPALKRYCEQVEAETEIVYVQDGGGNEPFWLRARTNGQTLLIYEYPRTLFALPRYLRDDFADPDNARRKSARIFGFFRKKIDKLRLEYADELAGEHMRFLMVK